MRFPLRITLHSHSLWFSRGWPLHEAQLEVWALGTWLPPSHQLAGSNPRVQGSLSAAPSPLPHSLCFAFPLVQVTFKNLASRPFSFHSTLQAYEETQGAMQGGEKVQPGELRKYSWKVLPQMAPTTQEFDCKAWAYFSNVDLVGGSLLHGASQEGEMGSTPGSWL